MDKEKFLAWIEIRLADQKVKREEIHRRNPDIHPRHYTGEDRRTYDYLVGQSAELNFIKECTVEHKRFD